MALNPMHELEPPTGSSSGSTWLRVPVRARGVSPVVERKDARMAIQESEVGNRGFAPSPLENGIFPSA